MLLLSYLFEKLFHGCSDVCKSPGPAHLTPRIRAGFSVCRHEARRSPAACGLMKMTFRFYMGICWLSYHLRDNNNCRQVPSVSKQPQPKPLHKDLKFKLPFLTSALPRDSRTTASPSAHNSSAQDSLFQPFKLVVQIQFFDSILNCF